MTSRGRLKLTFGAGALLAGALGAGCVGGAEAVPDGADSPDGANAATGSPAEAPPNTLTDAERAAGWRLLFDGETAFHDSLIQGHSFLTHVVDERKHVKRIVNDHT